MVLSANEGRETEMAESCQNCKKNGKCAEQKRAAKSGHESLWCAAWKLRK